MVDRSEAKAKGLPRYQGLPCKHGHDGERYTCGGGCVVCTRIFVKLLYRRKHPMRRKMPCVECGTEFERKSTRDNPCSPECRRVRHARLSLMSYRRRHKAKPNDVPVKPFHRVGSGMFDYNNARREHAFLLRCEGASYHDISARLGVSKARVQMLILRFAKQMSRACRMISWETKPHIEPLPRLYGKTCHG